MLRPSLRLLAAVLAVAFAPSPSHAHPELWSWMDALETESVQVSVDAPLEGEHATIVLEHDGQTIVLDLVRVQLSRAAVRQGPGPDTAGARLYRGVVRGDDASRVAVSIAAGRVGASIRTEASLLLVDAPDGAGAQPGLLYRGDDPLDGPTRLEAPALHARGVEESVFLLDIAAVADFEFFQKFGGGTEAQMLAVLNLVEAIYLDQVNVTFDVTFTQVHDQDGDPFSNFNSANLFNNYRDATAQFGQVRDQAGGAFEAAGLAHLFSDRNLNVPMGGKINAGFAFIDRLCDADQGVSISTAPTVGSSLHALIVAHEFGHNFGAPHDSEGACAATPANQFIMSPNATGNTFSACSKGIMTTNRDEASCIDEVAATTTTTLPPVLCGDATGDGNLLSSDALRVLRVAVGQFECLLCVCDADGSGAVSAPDALRVLRFSVGQSVALLCPAC